MKFLVSLLLLIGLLASPVHAATDPYVMGMNMLWADGDARKLESSFRRMKKLGITHARTDWEWRTVEAQQGVYDWGKTDKLVQLAYRYGITLLPIVHYAPQWALPEIEKPEGVFQLAPKEAAYTAYAKFLNASIDRYGPKGKAPFAFKPITHWQVWNEPNIREFWYVKSEGLFGGWEMEDAAISFVKLMQTVNNALGDRRQAVKIVHAGLSKSDVSYMWFLWNADPQYGRLFDVMAVHSYFFNPAGGVRGVDEVDEDNKDYASLGFIGGPEDHGYLPKVFNIQLFLKLKETPKPLWITEIGFMSNKTGPTPENPYILKEEDVAKLAEATLAYIAQRLTNNPFGQGLRGQDTSANVERVYWFMLDDYTFPAEMGNFGVYRADGTVREGLKNAVMQ